MKKQKLLGEVVYFNVDRAFGFIEIRDDRDGSLETFFFHRTKVTRRPVQIQKGNLALFEIGPFKPVRQGDVHHAIDVEIFDRRPAGGTK